MILQLRLRLYSPVFIRSSTASRFPISPRGLGVSAEKVMDITTARIQFGKVFCFTLSDQIDAAQFKSLLSPYRSESGLPLTLHYMRQGIGCEIRCPDEWRVAPVDASKQSLLDRLGVKEAAVEYSGLPFCVGWKSEAPSTSAWQTEAMG
jgi:hypothetical protein